MYQIHNEHGELASEPFAAEFSAAQHRAAKLSYQESCDMFLTWNDGKAIMRVTWDGVRQYVKRPLGVVAVATALAACVLTAPPADAEPVPCTSYDAISEMLAHDYKERPVGGGLAHTGKLLQVFTAEDGSTWTVVLTRPDGMTCIVAAGRHWQAIQQLVGKPA